MKRLLSLMLMSSAGLCAPAWAAQCPAQAWTDGASYQRGDQVTFEGGSYEAIVTHTAWFGAGWNPTVGSLWAMKAQQCDGGVNPPPPDNPGDTTDGGNTTPTDPGGNTGNPGSGDGGDSGSCGNAAAWSASTVYTQGMQAAYSGQIFQAKWWTQGDQPRVDAQSPWSSPWQVADRACDGSNGGDNGGDSGGGDNGGGTDQPPVDTTGWPKPLVENNRAYRNNTGHVVASYFVEWGVYGRNFPVDRIPATNLTHILYGFVPICGPNPTLQQENPAGYSALQSQCSGKPDYSVVLHDKFAALEKSYPGDKWDDPIRGNIGQLMKMKASNPGIRVLPSIGGWTLSDPFFHLANDAARRATFVSSVKTFLKTYAVFDGVDIDWEYPGGGGANTGLGSSSDRTGYTSLMRDLRAMLTQLGQETGRTYELTSAVGAGPVKIDQVDWQQASTYLDYVFAMTYDFYGAWSGELGHHAGLNPTAQSIHEGFTGAEAVTNLMAAGVPADKLVMGVAMYGRGWSGVTGGTVDNPFTGTGGNKIAGTWEAGVLDYRQIESAFQGGASGKGANGFVYYYDTQAQAPYLWNASRGELITYDDVRSARAKADFAKRNGLAGVFSWEIDADNGNILNAMHEGLGHSPK
jgi:chitinase